MVNIIPSAWTAFNTETLNLFGKVEFSEQGKDGTVLWVKCPYGKPGDRLWVRETWCSVDKALVGHDQFHKVIYRADGGAGYRSLDKIWKPSIHMPRWASRLTLEIKNISVERLQTMQPCHALMEGISKVPGGYGLPHWPHYRLKPFPRPAFMSLWDEIHGPGACDRNDWVWVVGFKVIKP